MGPSANNRSAEIVLSQSGDRRNAAKCVNKCLQRLSPTERQLVLRILEDRDDKRMDLMATRGISIIRLKQIRVRLEKCLRKCLEEIEANTLPV